MAIQTAAMRKALATAYGSSAPYGAVYTTAPGAAAGTEPSGGSPAYARKALTWSAPVTTGSTEVITSTATFDIPAGTTALGAGLHSAATGGTYMDGGSLTSQAFASQGTFAITFSLALA